MVQRLGVGERHPESVGHAAPSALRAAQKYFVKGKREETGQGSGREVGSQVFLISL